MKAAIGGIGVFPPAGIAHGECSHGGVGPVVRNIANDGVTRPAVGAVGERIAVAAVGGIGEVAEAIRASGYVGRDQDEFTIAGEALADNEGAAANRRDFGYGDFDDPRQGGGLGGESGGEFVERGGGAFDFGDHSGGSVQHVSGESKTVGELVHKWTKSHALHHAANADLPASQHHARW